MTKPHVSHSQLNLYWNCPEAYRRRYLEGDIRPPGIVLLVGSGVHMSAEQNFKQKIETHRDLPENDIVDMAVAGFEERMHKDGVELTAEERSVGLSKTVEKTTALVVDMAVCHANDQAPEYQPSEVEVKTTIELPNCSRNLVCITDLRTADQTVVDFKTSHKIPSPRDAHSSTQLTIEAAAHAVDTGTMPKEVRLDFIERRKDPRRTVVTSTRGPKDLEVLARRIETTVAAIETGVFAPANPGHWMCSAKWCGYHRTCPYASRES